MNTDSHSATHSARTDSVIEIAYRRKGLVALVLFLCVMAAAIALMIIPKRQTSETRVLVERSVPNAGDAKNADLSTFLNTQVELIKSATVLEPALDGPGVEDASVLPHNDNEISFLKQHIDVTPIPNSNVLSLKFAAVNSTEASAIIDSVAKAYVAHISAQRNNVAMSDFDALSKQRKSLDEDRINARAWLGQLKADTAGYDPASDPANNPVVKQAAELSRQVSGAELETVRLRSEFSEALRALGWNLEKYDAAKLAAATAVAPQSLDLLRSNMGALSQQLIEAKRQFWPTHPAVRTIQAQLKDMQLSQAATLNGMYAAAEATEVKMRQQLERQSEMASGLVRKATEMATLADRITSMDKQIALLDEKLSQMTLVETVGITARQLEAASIMEDSAVPNTWKTLAIAAVIGLMLGMMAALMREWVSPALGSVHRLADTVGVPLLGTLPKVAVRTPRELGDGDARSFRFRRRRSVPFDPHVTAVRGRPVSDNHRYLAGRQRRQDGPGQQSCDLTGAIRQTRRSCRRQLSRARTATDFQYR